MSLSGLFRDKCPKCGEKFSGIGTVTFKESWFLVKRTDNYTCKKCGHKWKEEKKLNKSYCNKYDNKTN